MCAADLATTSQTLAPLLAAGPMPPAEALRLALALAETLRRMHDGGSTHGGVSTSCIVLTDSGFQLLPALDGRTVTPYTAPELLAGQPADPRTDIFSFGAILFEMLTGRRAFEGESDAELVEAIQTAPTPTSGSPAVDRLVRGCLAKEPAARYPKMQKLMMELKLLAASVRRADAAAAAARKGEIADTLRSEMAGIEARIAERLQAHERRFSELQTTAADALGALRSELASTLDRISIGEERTKELSQALDSLNGEGAALRESVAADLGALDRSIKAQAAAIESARTAVAQTDDLVERVVEALESLQSTVLDCAENRPR